MRKAQLATLRRRSSCNALFATARPQPRRIFFRSSRRVCVRSRLPWVPAIACPSAPCSRQLCSYLPARVSCDAGPASDQIGKKCWKASRLGMRRTRPTTWSRRCAAANPARGEAQGGPKVHEILDPPGFSWTSSRVGYLISTTLRPQVQCAVASDSSESMGAASTNVRPLPRPAVVPAAPASVASLCTRPGHSTPPPCPPRRRRSSSRRSARASALRTRPCCLRSLPRSRPATTAASSSGPPTRRRLDPPS